jgi:hypothetical protein
MVKLESIFAILAFSMGVLAHPSIKHADRRFCASTAKAFQRSL